MFLPISKVMNAIFGDECDRRIHHCLGSRLPPQRQVQAFSVLGCLCYLNLTAGNEEAMPILLKPYGFSLRRAGIAV